MDLPININELRDIFIALQKDEKLELADRLKLVEELMVDGKPYKKILREKYNIVA
jgi:Trp operon repressor